MPIAQAESSSIASDNSDNVGSNEKNTVFVGNQGEIISGAVGDSGSAKPQPSQKPDGEDPKMIPGMHGTSVEHPDVLSYQQQGRNFLRKYREVGNLSDLEASVKNYQTAVDLTPDGHPDRAVKLQNLAVSLTDRYQRLGDLEDLRAAMQMKQEAVELTPNEDPERAGRLRSLGVSLTDRYRRLGDLKDLEAAVQIDQQVLELTPDDHPDRAGRLHSLAVSIADRYQRLGDLKDLEAALHMEQEVVKLTADEDPNRAGRLHSLAVSLTEQYRRLGDLKDLEAALQTCQKVVDLTPENHHDRAGRLHSLAVLLTDRYKRLGDLKDLEAALKTAQKAVELTPDGHPDRAGQLHGLAVLLREQYLRLGDLQDLEAALHTDQEVLKLTLEGNPDRAERLHHLSVSLKDRYRRLGDLKDLQAALQTIQEAVSLTPHQHPHRAGQLESLAVSLGERYQRVGDLDDLENALKINREVVELTPDEHPDMAGRLHSLAVSLISRYKRLGHLDDLEAGLQAHRQAVDLTPDGHADCAKLLHGLAVSLTFRYRRLGDLKDLESSLQNNQEGVKLTPDDHPDKEGRLHALGLSFTDRYQRLGDLKDLQASLQIFRKLVELTPDKHPERAARLHSLAVCYLDHHRRFGHLTDLEPALQMFQEAVNLTSDGHPSRAVRLQGLSAALGDRYRRLGDLKDLEATLQIDREAVELTPIGHPDLMRRLLHLGISLITLYRRLGNLKDLDAGLQTHKQAVDLTPNSHPDRARRLQSLASSTITRYMKFKRPEDLQAVHNYYTDSFKSTTSTPETSWEQALLWALFSADFQPSYCVTAYREAFGLLPEILSIGHSIPVRHNALRRINVQDATSNSIKICIDLSEIEAGVEFLEQGLATTFQQMLQLRTEVDLLPPHRAKDFLDLSAQLYNGTSANPMVTVSERDKLIEDIRKQPGMEYFLLSKPFNVLCHASREGPVVLLSNHRNHCDAIIILNPTAKPVHVPLRDVTMELLKSQQDMLKDLLGRCNVRSRGETLSSRLSGRRENFSSKPTEECFEDMLKWLWTCVVSPIYQVLKVHDITTGRLWWLPAGAFTGLPLHACPPMDDFIHSYTATLGSLLDAYGKEPPGAEPKISVVGVTHTGPGRSDALKGVGEEITKITSIVKNPHIHCLEGEQATVNTVKLQLQDCSWVHLACHGYQNLGDPTKSHLKLYGGDLDLETILRMNLSNAQFVFLAACQTAKGDAQLVNESFHLGGGFIAAGFRGAIGTMWSMQDEDGPIVAEIVYSHLFRKGQQQPQVTDAAEALHLAVKELKRRRVPYQRWVPFIHMGI